MTPQLLTYVLFFGPLLILGYEWYTYRKNKKKGLGYRVRPLELIACVIVMVLALAALITGHTYQDLIRH